MGPSAGGAVYSPAMTDFIAMVKNTSYMFITGPDVVKTVTNEEVTSEELGGAAIVSASGAVDNVAVNETEAIAMAKKFLSYLPGSVLELPTVIKCNDPSFDCLKTPLKSNSLNLSSNVFWL